MESLSSVLFWFAFALYIGATVLYAYQFVLKRSKVAWWARFLTGAGFICQTASIAAASIATGGTIYSGRNQLILASWALILVYFVMEHVLRIRAYGAFLVPIAVIVLSISILTGSGAEGYQLTPEQQFLISSSGIALHVALIVFANAGFAFAAVSAGLHLYQDSQLRHRRSSKVSRRLPSLATLQNVTRRSIALAYPVYTAGLTLGVLRAIQTDVGGWWADPRVMMAGLVWLTYTVYLIIVYRRDVSSVAASRIAILGFVLVVITSILARTVEAGFHVFGV